MSITSELIHKFKIRSLSFVNLIIQLLLEKCINLFDSMNFLGIKETFFCAYKIINISYFRVNS